MAALEIHKNPFEGRSNVRNEERSDPNDKILKNHSFAKPVFCAYLHTKKKIIGETAKLTLVRREISKNGNSI